MERKYSGDPRYPKLYWAIFEILRAIKLINFEVLFKMSSVMGWMWYSDGIFLKDGVFLEKISSDDS